MLTRGRERDTVCFYLQSQNQYCETVFINQFAVIELNLWSKIDNYVGHQVMK